MNSLAPLFEVTLAQDAVDLRAAQRLRYEVFVRELGGDGALVDHDAGLERDRFDEVSDHLILRDISRPRQDGVVGVYRLMDDAAARRAGGFYSEQEYDLSPLLSGGRRLLELGRSCVHPDYRGGTAMYHLWQGLAEYIEDNGIEVLFGVASFHGTDLKALEMPLSLLHHNHLAPPELRVRSRLFEAMDLVPKPQIDRLAAMQATPALIKAYLRLGGVVGEGAFVDHAFNTTDVCLLVDTARMSTRQKALYSRPGRF
ncbi:MAG: GNAT family N-acyltransferase [Flavimaricola sp.]|nr:GNAT family N-acyltransferase [Flavimaricola sp.]